MYFRRPHANRNKSMHVTISLKMEATQELPLLCHFVDGLHKNQDDDGKKPHQIEKENKVKI